jgi:hypothetical protein
MRKLEVLFNAIDPVVDTDYMLDPSRVIYPTRCMRFHPYHTSKRNLGKQCVERDKTKSKVGPNQNPHIITTINRKENERGAKTTKTGRAS